MDKLWGGRFSKETDQLVDQFTASIFFDQKLAAYDIEGSIAHVEMLGSCGILSDGEVKKIKDGLLEMKRKAEKGELHYRQEDEDIHMNIERSLLDAIGPVAGKLHTARSRNDQVATDMHLYLREKIDEILSLLLQVEKEIVEQAKKNVETIFPGYTHLQRAQPISFAHHLLAYFWMFERDRERYKDSLKRVNWLPLGAGALAGTTFPIDRFLTAKKLGFDFVYPNSIDAVSDRDFILEFLANSSILMMHLSRLAEELVLWSSQEFQFIEIDDAFCTGSSIMPQKKNPDVPELIRGKTGRVYGNLIGLLTVMKGLPLAYNKDLQEDKEGMFDTVITIEQSLQILAPLLRTMEVRKERMAEAIRTDYSNATDLADYLAKKGIPFREAHDITGKIVYYAITKKKSLLELSLNEYRSYSPLFEEDLYQAIDPRQVMAARNSYGGTSPEQVAVQLRLAEERVRTNP